MMLKDLWRLLFVAGIALTAIVVVEAKNNGRGPQREDGSVGGSQGRGPRPKGDDTESGPPGRGPPIRGNGSDPQEISEAVDEIVRKRRSKHPKGGPGPGGHGKSEKCLHLCPLDCPEQACPAIITSQCAAFVNEIVGEGKLKLGHCKGHHGHGPPRSRRGKGPSDNKHKDNPCTPLDKVFIDLTLTLTELEDTVTQLFDDTTVPTITTVQDCLPQQGEPADEMITFINCIMEPCSIEPPVEPPIEP